LADCRMAAQDTLTGEKAAIHQLNRSSQHPSLPGDRRDHYAELN
jgi:hypothetical protein